jgi:hypothetical protein
LGIKPLAFRVSHGIKAEMGLIPSPINDRLCAVAASLRLLATSSSLAMSLLWVVLFFSMALALIATWIWETPLALSPVSAF